MRSLGWSRGSRFVTISQLAVACWLWTAGLNPAQAESGAGLQIQAANHSVIVSWNATNFWLQASENLATPLAWYNTYLPAVGGGPPYNLIFPVDATARFFRLVQSGSLPPPTGLQALADNNQMFVSWDSVSNAASYDLYWASDPAINQGNAGTLPNGGALPGITNTLTVLDNLLPGLRYYFVVTAVSPGIESAPSNLGSDVFGSYGEVHGSFFTTVITDTGAHSISLPGVLVTLSNATYTTQTTTDGEGEFALNHVLSGTYQLCWTASGFGPGRFTNSVVVFDDIVALPPQELFVPTNAGCSGWVFGVVSLLDGTVPVLPSELFGGSIATVVTLGDASQHLVGSTAVNQFGEYVMAGVPQGSNFVLTASTEMASVTTNIDTTVIGRADLVFPVASPVIQSIRAVLNGQPVTFAPTNTTVQIQVQAADPQGFPLHYYWSADSGAAGFVSVDASNVSLTLPSDPGLVRVEVQVRNAHGGYASTRSGITAGLDSEFNGYVRDISGSFLVGAQVNANGVQTTTDSNGFFSVTLPNGLGPFAFAVVADGYAPLYRNLDASAAGQVWTLTPITSQCVPWTGEPAQFTDASGATLQLQGNSLQSHGTNYYGQICVNLLNYDPCSYATPFPAGYEAIDAGGQTNWLEPQATALVTITDDLGNPLQFAPGLPGLLTIPSGLSCNNTNIDGGGPVTGWVWDPAFAEWRLGGQFSPTGGGGGQVFYFGPVLQMGLFAVGAADAPALSITVLADRTINYPFQVRLSSQTEPVTVTGEPLKVDFMVPSNKLVTVEVLSPKEAPGDYYTNPSDASTFKAFKDKTAILRIQKAFTNSGALKVTLVSSIPNLSRPSLIQDNPIEDDRHFLTYRSTGIETQGGQGVGNTYYGTVAGYKVNDNGFLKFLSRNGFLPNGGKYPADYVDDAHALYFNSGDLGFARSMHMRVTPGIDGETNIAFFVINYANAENALADKADQKAPEYNSARVVATVCMDYRADVTGGQTNRFTKFFVADNGKVLRTEAELDNAGAKFNPNLCVNCHGTKPIDVLPTGAPPPKDLRMNPPSGDVGGRFIPFDLQSFTYSSKVGVQQDQFRALNRGIYKYTPLTPAMKELLEGWYSGPLTDNNNNNFKVGFVPPGWSANPARAALYTSVVAISCRSCHVTRDTSASGNNLAFNTYDSFNSAGLRDLLCERLLMPNAQRTFTIFWGSMSANQIKPGVVPDQPTLLKNEFGLGPCPAPKP